MRGSSDILAALDSHIAVKRDESRAVELTQTKSRGAEELKPFRVAIGLETIALNLIMRVRQRSLGLNGKRFARRLLPPSAQQIPLLTRSRFSKNYLD